MFSVYTNPDIFENATFLLPAYDQRIQKVADTKSSPSTLIQKSCVFKFIHFGERFQKLPFSDTENAVLVWTEGLSG